jgi:DNA-binding NarL/FixJ family response regulator
VGLEVGDQIARRVLQAEHQQRGAALVRSYLDRLHRGDDVGGLPGRPITEREEEILKLVAEGHTSREIGTLLFISAETVERHRANLLQKPGMRDRLELTRYAIRAGLIDP